MQDRKRSVFKAAAVVAGNGIGSGVMAIPYYISHTGIAGGVIAGGITYASFKPCCSRLKSVLMDTLLSNPDHVSDSEEEAIAESILAGSDIPDIEP